MFSNIKLAMIIIFNIKITTANLTGFIVKGSASKIVDFPYSAFLVMSCHSSRGDGYFSCGSSIVNQVTLLTAGHCFVGCINISDAFATYGHEKLKDGFLAKMFSFKIHENHLEGSLTNDIALVILEKELKLRRKVSRVGILKRIPSYDGAPTVAGWGKVKEQAFDVSDVLMYTRQQILPRMTCQFTLNNPDGTFCAESMLKMGYPSGADSGSALVVSDFIQIGLVSYKNPGISTRITVYTNISYFYSWINLNSKKLYCKRIKDRSDEYYHL